MRQYREAARYVGEVLQEKRKIVEKGGV